ncbi:MAG: anaerobic C4-dicarboxylate transporter [Bacteroidetes bacterium]|nr:anaerobic C4-dicarboxylate transporter [Bacteroidota bacterium]
MFWIELLVVLISIFIGARLRGVGLGIMGGLGLFILTIFFHLKPDNPPYNVLLVIMSVVTAGMALEAAGGLKYLTSIGEKLIRKNPNQVTFVAPFVTFLFTFLTGTSHITYSLFPVISDVALKAGIRPEKPLSASAVAALQAIVASPISAFTSISLSIFGAYGFDLFSLLKIYVPAALLGVLGSTLVANKIGKSLKDDPELKDKLKELKNDSKINSDEIINFSIYSKLSVLIFLLGVIGVIVLLIPFVKPFWIINGQKIFLTATSTVSIVMLSTSALIVLFCKAKPYNMIRGKVSIAGMQAVIAILGIAWLGNTLFKGNLDYINSLIKESILNAPWKFCFFLFFINTITTSQAATLKMLIPLGLIIGLPPKMLIGFLPAINSIFFIPNYPTMVAAMEFDKTGSTRIGKYILNHSFMIPGLVSTSITLLVSIFLSKLIL